MSTNEEAVLRLNETIEHLSATLARAELRQQANTRWLRLIAAALLAVVILVFTVGGNALREAQAQAAASTDPVAAELARLHQTIGAMAEGIGGFFGDPALGGTLADAGVLVRRLKQDSDALRLVLFCRSQNLGISECADRVEAGTLELPPGTDMKDIEDAPEAMMTVRNLDTLERISSVLRNELEKLNNLLVAIPEMRAEMAIMRHDMNVMSGQMGVMAGSMGSTMGRASRWMPW